MDKLKLPMKLPEEVAMIGWVKDLDSDPLVVLSVFQGDEPDPPGKYSQLILGDLKIRSFGKNGCMIKVEKGKITQTDKVSQTLLGKPCEVVVTKDNGCEAVIIVWKHRVGLLKAEVLYSCISTVEKMVVLFQQ